MLAVEAANGRAFQDISLKSKTPSFQMDADIDLDLPPAEPDDGAGFVYTADGRDKTNVFRMRVELSHIGGKVYDLLYSTRARKASPQQRALRVQRLEARLRQWRQKIPARLQMDVAPQTLPQRELMQMATLYHTFLTTLVMVHGIYSHDADWVQRVSAYGKIAMLDCDPDRNGSCDKQLPPLPHGWAACVEASRSCMQLFAAMPQTDCAVW